MGFPSDGGCVLIPDANGKQCHSPGLFNRSFPITIQTIPELGPLEYEETLLAEETVRRSLGTHRASRHFRNYWRLYPDRFESFAELVARTALFKRNMSGEVVMLNMLRLKETADYSAAPELAPEKPISGRDAFQKYIDHTMPFLKHSGGELLLLGNSGQFFIGPEDERWDVIMLVKQSSLASFMAFATNAEYLAGIGHIAAATIDSWLLPIVECEGNNITSDC